jgi:cytochrome oxidase Cu insertion factor (SCO1/SenC/PrrC family)
MKRFLPLFLFVVFLLAMPTIAQSHRRGMMGGVDRSPAVGETAPDFTLRVLNSDQDVTLSDLYKDKPVVLTLGSYTCPPFRRALEGMEDLVNLTMPMVVDTLENEVEQKYVAAPNRTYLIGRDGTILYKGVRGPQGTRPTEIEQALLTQGQ